MRALIVSAIAALSIVTFGVAPLRAQTHCTGDLDGSGAVTVDELVVGVNITLGLLPLTAGPLFDADNSGDVTVDELVRAVSYALEGCPDVIDDTDTVPAASRDAPNLIGATDVIDFGLVGNRRIRRFRNEHAGAAAGCGSSERVACQNGGERHTTCRCEGSNSVLEEALTNCDETDAETGTVMTQNGVRTRTIADAAFCDTGVIPDSVTVTQRFSHYAASFTCTRTAECPPGLQDAVLRSEDLTTVQQPMGSSGDLETTLAGDLAIENRATGERFAHRFETAFRVMKTAAGFMLNGRTSVDCFGDVVFDTKVPIALDPGDTCPAGGSLEVMRSRLLRAGAADWWSVTSGHAGAGSVGSNLPAERARRSRSTMPEATNSIPHRLSGQSAADTSARYRELKFRAANGQVYQVLQNTLAPDSGGDTVIGAEDIRLTTVVGSFSPDLGGCFKLRRAQAFVATESGAAFPLDRVFKSPLIADASPPCFNANGAGGNGTVCIGPDCTIDCTCAGGANCTTYSIGGTKLSAASPNIPAATLADPLSVAAGACSGFAGGATYGFGTLAPTTEVPQCSPAPADGFTLPGAPSALHGAAGSTLILAYDTPLLAPFGIGSAGFALDSDRSNADGCSGAQPVLAGVIQANSIPPNRIEYTAARGVQFDFNGDTLTDKSLTACDAPSLRQCAAPPPPTPSLPPTGQCAPFPLGSTFPLSRNGSTARDAVNAAGGATCGGGGNQAPDFAFRYAAPAAGFYTISTNSASFDTVLYVRRDTCGGAELACNDDQSGGSLESQVIVPLDANETVVIVVDGYRRERGTFTLTIDLSQTPPTPTPTPEPGAGPPDLVVTEVISPLTGTASEPIEVSATVENRGLSDAGAFEVEFVFSTDETITPSDVRSGFGCVFSRLAAHGEVTCSGPIGVPSNLPAGTYSLGAIVDLINQVAEANESNNARAADNTITIGGGVATATPSSTQPLTPSRSVTPSRTATLVPTDTRSATPAATPTATSTGTVAVTATPTLTRTATPATGTWTPTASVTPAPTRTATPKTLGGLICSDTTWRFADSPLIATSSVIVGGALCPQGQQTPTLTIEAGVEVRFNANRFLEINGTLLARGTAEQRILFTSNNFPKAAGDWDGIRFKDTATDATFDGDGNYISGSIMEYCTVEYARDSVGTGIVALISAAPHFRFVTVRSGNATGGSITGGIGITGTLGVATVRIANVEVTSISGAGIFVSGLDAAASVLVVGATLFANEYVGIYADNAVRIADSTISENGNAGVYCHGPCVVTGSCISRNGSPLIVVPGATLQFERNTVAAHASPVSVQVQPTSFAMNNLTGGTGQVFENRLDSASPALIAENNWWGTTDFNAIGDLIYDCFDDGTRGCVDFTPFATGPIADAPDIDACANGTWVPPGFSGADASAPPRPANMLLRE
ncbi:MAG: right-handed parallel beta-helix repeat-containing protein [Deltaproteobacteria bacterium]|nr:right-handed parallel beta-helix repeat-containing protein [Deltaproteobacteria bacterium]